MAIVYEQRVADIWEGISGTSKSITVENTPAENSLMFWHAIVRGTSLYGPLTWPSGWSQLIYANPYAKHLHCCAYKFATASEPSSYTLSWVSGTSANWTSVIHEFSGVASYGGGSSKADASDSTPELPSVTTDEDNCLCLGVVADSTSPCGGNYSPPSGYTEIFDIKYGHNANSVAYDILETAGSTGSPYFTSAASPSIRQRVGQFWFRPAASGPPYLPLFAQKQTADRNPQITM